MDFIKEAGLFDNHKGHITTETKGTATIYTMCADAGSGTMTCYTIFDGIWLSYNDFHCGHCLSGSYSNPNLVEINHCRQGRFECDFDGGACAYLEEGDLSVHKMSSGAKNACFPLEHYHGISIIIDLAKANQSISGVLGDVTIDLINLRDKLCPDKQCFIMRATDGIEHIFCELYRLPDKIKLGYLKVKVLELLLFLSMVEVDDNIRERSYFRKNHVTAIKAIKQHMIEHIDCHFTLDELSAQFAIPLTSMKLCFKGVYGTSIYAYMRAYRMQSAATLLRSSEQSISAIAAQVGYVNASKFACAFKEIMGQSPLAYRQKNCLVGAKVG